jgi:ActR/RegA family two-component response regulator
MAAHGMQKTIEIIPIPRILLVDDDKSFIRVQKQAFERYGAILDSASGFDKADIYMKQHSYDHIFVDYKFEDEHWNGIEYINARPSQFSNIPTTMITSVQYHETINNEIRQRKHITFLAKGIGWSDKLNVILEKLNEDKFTQFVSDIKKTVPESTIVRICEKSNESNLQKKIRKLFLSSLGKIEKQQKASLVLGGKTWSADTLADEVEKKDSHHGDMALELFVTYLEYSMEKGADQGNEHKL